MGKVQARSLGLIPTLAQERATGHRAPVPPQKPRNSAKTHVWMDDNQWTRRLINSGVDLAKLDNAFSVSSRSRLTSLLVPILKAQPPTDSKEESVLKALRHITASAKVEPCATVKFNRIRPIYWRMRD